jgi:hypothetical protein
MAPNTGGVHQLEQSRHHRGLLGDDEEELATPRAERALSAQQRAGRRDVEKGAFAKIDDHSAPTAHSGESTFEVIRSGQVMLTTQNHDADTGGHVFNVADVP